MLQWLAQFLTAPIINGFLDAYKAKLAAANAQGAQAVEDARAALLAEIEARKSADAVILAEQGRWYTAIIRPLLAAPVVIYLWKVIVWDIVLSLGTTDPSSRSRTWRPSSSACRPRSTRCTRSSSKRRRRRRVGGLDRDRLCRRPLQVLTDT